MKYNFIFHKPFHRLTGLLLLLVFSFSSIGAANLPAGNNPQQNNSPLSEIQQVQKSPIIDSPQENGLALTPPMGFNNWARYGCGNEDIESTFARTADAMVAKGLAAKGYLLVTVDDCWMKKSRDAKGNLVADPTRFPDGMKWLSNYMHGRGLKFGLYLDGGTQTCAGYPGSYGHFEQDVNLFASWEVDYIKLDFCNPPATPDGTTFEAFTHQIYSEMASAIKKSGRPMILSESAPAYFLDTPEFSTVMGWVANYGNLWRISEDIPNHGTQDKWAGIVNNYERNIILSAFARPGSWNDPDFLITGDDDGRLTNVEQQSQMSLWSIMAAPLIISSNINTLTYKPLLILENKEVIAIDQDSLGLQGSRVKTEGGVDVIAKKLANGDIAVALFNKNNPDPVTGSVNAKTVGFSGPGCYSVRDIWADTTIKTNDVISAKIGPHATALLRVSPGKGCK